MKPRVTILAPAYNEEQVIEGFADAILKTMEDDWEFLIVDDGSRDRTAPILKDLAALDPRIRIVTHPMNFGLGAALATGFRHARGDVIVTLDADLSHPLDLIPQLVAGCVEADAVYASRYVKGGGMVGVPLMRAAISIVANLMLRVLFLTRLRDLTTGFRAYRREAVHGLEVRATGFDVQFEISIRLIAAGSSIREVPLVLTTRAAGASKMRYARLISRYVRTLVKMLGVRYANKKGAADGSSGEQRFARWLLIAALVGGSALRVWVMIGNQSINVTDEIYQTLEPAHRLVFGYGFVAWEFVLGARHWALPGMIAGILKLSSAIGLDDPRGYLLLVRGVFVAMSVATIYAVYRLARAWKASKLAAAIGGTLFGLLGLPVYFAHRTFSDSASALPITLGFALALPQDARRWQRLLGVSLLGLSVMWRVQNVVFCFALLAILIGRRRAREFVEASAALAIWALLFGIIDLLTWGGWFHSALTNIRVLWILSKSAPAPTQFDVSFLINSLSTAFWFLLVLALLAVRRAAGLATTVFVSIFLLLLFPYKELRHVLPVFPMLCALAGIGFDTLWKRIEAIHRAHWKQVLRTITAAAFTFALVSSYFFSDLMFANLGEFEKIRPGADAGADSGSINRLFMRANDQEDLCGLRVQGSWLVWTGGYTYLHRKVPLYGPLNPPASSAFYNYEILPLQALSAGQEPVAFDGRFELMRRSDGGCSPDRNFDSQLQRITELFLPPPECQQISCPGLRWGTI